MNCFFKTRAETRAPEDVQRKDVGEGVAVEGQQEDGGAEAAEAVVPVLRKAVLRRPRPSLLGTHEHAAG